jgi:hypothetical protein
MSSSREARHIALRDVWASSIDTHLHGRALALARATWYTLVLLVLVVFVMGLPETFGLALALRPETVAGLAQLGLAPSFNAIYICVLDSLTLLGFLAFAVLIFLRRPDDWMVMFVGLTLLLTGMLYTAPPFEAGVPILLLALLAGLAEISQVAFVYLFPDGRFFPWWSWLLLLPLLVWRPAIWGLVYLPHFLALQAQGRTSGEDFYVVPQDTRDLALFLALLVVGVVAQVYRYRRHSTAIQRQQTKWLVLGVGVTVAVVGTYVLAINLIDVPQASGGALIVRLLSRTINHVALLCLPIALTFSILRYRLWDIDILINRALVYGTLTGLLALFYAASVALMQGVIQVVTGREQRSALVLVVSTLATAALFQPLRRRIQDGIDRRFYRHKYDAARTLEAFTASLRQEMDLPQLSERLVSVVEETMEPSEVSLWLARPDTSSGAEVGSG